MITGEREKVKREKLSLLRNLFLLFLGLYLLAVFLRGIWEIKGAYRRIAEADAKLIEEEKVRLELVEKRDQVGALEYVEDVARNELNMQKEGEKVVVLPETGRAGISDGPAGEEEQEPANWKKWWNLLK